MNKLWIGAAACAATALTLGACSSDKKNTPVTTPVTVLAPTTSIGTTGTQTGVSTAVTLAP